MEVRLVALADFASLTREGKLNILGIFDRINPPSLPYTHPNMFLVTVFEASPAEAGLTRTVRVVLLDADANEMLSLEQQVTVPQSKRSGTRISINQLVGFAGLKFSTPGDYQFLVLVGDDEKASVSLAIVDTTQASNEES